MEWPSSINDHYCVHISDSTVFAFAVCVVCVVLY
jgi:hypothetical protein